MTLFVDEAVLAVWSGLPDKRVVGQAHYPDSIILCSVLVQAQFGLPYRQAQGFMQSMVGMLGMDLEVPDYTTVNRRFKKMDIGIDLARLQGSHTRLAVDSTGLKVSGQGEWLIRKHVNRKDEKDDQKASSGRKDRRRWMKLHLSVDIDSGELVGCALYPDAISDSYLMKDLLVEQAEVVYADGAYDREVALDAIADCGAVAMVPPRRDAVEKEGEALLGWELDRNRRVLVMKDQGLEGWKKGTDYHKRSRIETEMYRYKTAFGGKLRHRSLEGQQNETSVRCRLLNTFTALGRPQTVAVQ